MAEAISWLVWINRHVQDVRGMADGGQTECRRVFGSRGHGRRFLGRLFARCSIIHYGTNIFNKANSIRTRILTFLLQVYNLWQEFQGWC